MLEKIAQLLAEVSSLTAENQEQVEALRLKYLSKKGEINNLMADFRNVPAEQKKEVGMKINELKQAAFAKINELKENCESSESADESIDLTRTAYPINLGSRHPLTIVKNEIVVRPFQTSTYRGREAIDLHLPVIAENIESEIGIGLPCIVCGQIQ